MTTYYVDSINGSDSNSGLSEASPRKTLASVVTLMGVGSGGSAQGHTLRAKRGSVFTETMNLYYGGTSSTNKLIISDYGYGPKPLIDIGPVSSGGTHTRGIYLRTTNLGRVTIENWAITGHGPGVIGGISHPVSDINADVAIIVRNVDVYDIYDSNNPASDVNGVKFIGSNVLIESCHIYDIATDGLYLSGSSGIVVKKNTIERVALDTRDAGDCFVLINKSNDYVIEENTFDHSNFTCKQGFFHGGAGAETGSGGIFRKNTVKMKPATSGFDAYPLYSLQPGVKFISNTIEGGYNNTTFPMMLILGANSIATGNLVINSIAGGNGIRLEGANSAAYNNTIVNTSGNITGTAAGISNLNATTNLTIENNIVSGFGRGIDYYSTTTITERNNILYNNTAAKVFSNTGAEQSLGTASSTANPLLDSSYIPASNSPAIGAGYKYWTGARPSDVNGEPLPDTFLDIGAYQSTGNAGHPKNLVNSANPSATLAELLSYTPAEVEAQLDKVTELNGRVDVLELGTDIVNTFPANSIVPDGVTDVGPALRAFIDKAKITASATNRVKLILHPGTYNVTGTLDFGPYIDIDMRGAILSFSDNTVNTKVKIGSDSASFKGGTYLGLNIKNTNSFNNHKYQAGLVGLEITNCQNSHIQIIEVSGFTIGILLSAFGTTLYTAYNNIYLNSIVRCKVCIQIHNKGHGNSTNPAWINENKFFGGNFMPTSDLDAFGSCYGIEFTNSGTLPYLGSNQNIFHSPSFQLSEPTAWSSGKTGIRQYYIYYNPTTFIEYRVTSVGEAQVAGTTAPTHTTGIVADSAGVSWEYVGPCRRAPVFYNNNGGFNRIYAARWELGFGPFMIAKGTPNNTNGSRTRGNIFEIYQKQGVNTIYTGADECDETCFDNAAIASAFTEVVSYDKQRGVTETYNNLHLRAVESSAGVTVPGFENGTATGTTSDKNIASGSVEILYDGLHFKSTSNGIALFLKTDKTKRFRISYVLGEGAENRGRIQVRCYDSTRTLFSDLQTVGVARAWGNFATTNASSYSQTNTASDDNAIATRHDTKWARVWFQGETGTKSIIKTIAIETKVNHMDKNINLVEVENRLPLDFNKRYSNGTPIAGAFLVLGEQITNISGTAGQPLYWTVSVAGYLCKAWVTGTTYKIGSMVSNAGTNYRSTVDHVASAAFATDSANWVSLGTPSTLTASTQTY